MMTYNWCVCASSFVMADQSTRFELVLAIDQCACTCHPPSHVHVNIFMTSTVKPCANLDL